MMIFHTDVARFHGFYITFKNVEHTVMFSFSHINRQANLSRPSEQLRQETEKNPGDDGHQWGYAWVKSRPQQQGCG